MEIIFLIYFEVLVDQGGVVIGVADFKVFIINI